MASMERFEELLGEADEAKEQAVLAMASARGSERPALYASIAAMCFQEARLEHDLFTAETLKRQVASWGRRLYAIEKKMGMSERDMPDPFAERDVEPDEIDELLEGI